MKRKIFSKNSLTLATKMAKYNIRIIFAEKFIWFLLASFALMIFFSVQKVLQQDIISEDMIYGILMLPGVILVFYPAVFGIQSDQDNGLLEILFGIPDYRYKVWLIRLLMVFVVTFVILVLYGLLLQILLIPFNIWEMTYQLMYPTVFIGGVSFMFSTIVKNGNGTAVIMVLIAMAFYLLGDALVASKWNIFLNPLEVPEDTNELIWANTVSDNRLFLGIGIIVSIVFGLFNLQKREKFI